MSRTRLIPADELPAQRSFTVSLTKVHDGCCGTVEGILGLKRAPGDDLAPLHVLTLLSHFLLSTSLGGSIVRRGLVAKLFADLQIVRIVGIVAADRAPQSLGHQVDHGKVLLLLPAFKHTVTTLDAHIVHKLTGFHVPVANAT